MKKEIQQRRICRLCNSPELTIEVNLPNIYIADSYAYSENQYTEKYPIDLYRCKKCGHIQVVDIIAKDILFNKEYTYKPSRNKKLVEHFTQYAELLKQYIATNPKCLDIGSNDGLFLQCLEKAFEKTICHGPKSSPSK